MKIKDITALGLLALVLIVIGVLLIGHLGKGSKKHSAQIEIVRSIDSSFDQKGREILLSADKTQPVESFQAPINLSQGLGNTSPFRPNQ